MRCLYLRPQGELGVVNHPGLDSTTERHKIELEVEPYGWQGDATAALGRDASLRGLVIECERGWVGRSRLGLSKATLGSGHRVWIHWPGESAVECLDGERIASLRRHWYFINGYWAWTRTSRRVQDIRQRLRAVIRDVPPRQLPRWALRKLLGRPGQATPVHDDPRARSAAARVDELNALIAAASPVAFPTLAYQPTKEQPIPGYGAYLRTDFWAPLQSGGSYGHTCYVAKELAAVSQGFVCFVANHYSLLDDYKVRQVVLERPGPEANEDDIVRATPHYVSILKPALEAIRPAYIYERLCIGNYAGAVLSKTLNIPYIVEYNGSEISMRRTFDGLGYIYEQEYLLAEALAFKQATMISVVSAEVGNSLVKSGVDASKILINPNGADLTAYAPADAAERNAIGAELGLPANKVVVGFTGTFGGWHGVDVLADAMPKICARMPSVHFLLIGDGNYKHLVDKAVADHHLEERVTAVGRVPQAKGARYLKACDIYVSPHNSHMIDSRFFGSPTKIFEYMAMGGGVVASDLEQIGEILSPALRVSDLRNASLEVADQRAVLCEPGALDEFVDAVVALAERPDLWAPLGRNARTAVEKHYSWARHVARLWPFAAGDRSQVRQNLSTMPLPAAMPAAPEPAPAPAVRTPQVATGDVYKDEVQKQWDNDPAGSHYVKEAQKHTLEWFKEVEAYRYDEYAPWMFETMEFGRHSGERVLEVGGGIGTDLSQFARHGALVTDCDLSSGHLELAQENFKLRGLPGDFVLHDAEVLPFPDNSFDIVYSNGVLHHTPNTTSVVREIFRVLKPGGRAIIMMYAENSLHYWRNLVWAIGLKDQDLQRYSMGEIMSRAVERSDNASARPLVKVYTRPRLRKLFDGFEHIEIVQRQMVPAEKPGFLARVPVATLGNLIGWNLVIKAQKPMNAVTAGREAAPAGTAPASGRQ